MAKPTEDRGIEKLLARGQGDYVCAHCGEVSGMYGHHVTQVLEDGLCESTVRIDDDTGRFSGFACRPGHACRPASRTLPAGAKCSTLTGPSAARHIATRRPTTVRAWFRAMRAHQRVADPVSLERLQAQVEACTYSDPSMVRWRPKGLPHVPLIDVTDPFAALKVAHDALSLSSGPAEFAANDLHLPTYSCLWCGGAERAGHEPNCRRIVALHAVLAVLDGAPGRHHIDATVQADYDMARDIHVRTHIGATFSNCSDPHCRMVIRAMDSELQRFWS